MKLKGNVLVVDDEIGPRESLRMIMKPHYHIETAKSGSEALRRISEQSFDLITLDLNMRDMHGIEILKKIKEQEEALEVVIVTGYGTLSTAQQAIRYGAFDYITKPFSVSEMVSVAGRAICRKHLQDRMRQMTAHMQRTFAAESEDKDEAGKALPVGLNPPLEDVFSQCESLNLIDFIKVLSRTLEEKNAGMHQHSERVDHYARVIAEAMNISERDQEYLRTAAFLHDIGKVGISNDILNKAGALLESEWTEIKEHPRRGVEIVEPLSLPQEVLSIILHHHESFDGGGYPDGLERDEIPLCARIIRIIDSFDAMMSNRPYRSARSFDSVVQELKTCSGSQFDPEIVDVFVDILTTQKECSTPVFS